MRQTTREPFSFPSSRPADGLSGGGGDMLTEVIRQGARELLAQAVEAEVAEYIDARTHLNDESGRRLVVRNGHLPTRSIVTGVGAVPVTQPRVPDRRPASGGA